MNGYAALRTGAAWLDLSARGKIKLTGEDRARLLHAMTTNHIQQLTPGTGCYAFFLTAQGRILSDANILCRPDHFLLDLEPETREKIYQHLDHYIIADDVTLEDVTEQNATIAVEGPKSQDVLHAAGAPTAVAADAEAFRVVRLEQGRARYGEDLSERFLAQEANQKHALHFSKGCYLGQEIVERVRSRGQIHRMLMPLQLDTKEAPPAGTKLQAGETNVAEITSAAFSPALDKVVALAYVRTEFARPHAYITMGPIQAEVVGAT